MRTTTLLWGGVMIPSRGGFELVLDRLVSLSWFLLMCSVNSLISVSLDVRICTVHLIYLSLSDCVSVIR